jgi:hypothetical protein
MTDLFALTGQMAAAVQAFQEAEREARHAGQIERAITFQLVLRSGADALLALAELLESEGTRTRSLPVVDRRVGAGCGRPRNRTRLQAGLVAFPVELSGRFQQVLCGACGHGGQELRASLRQARLIADRR